MRIYIENKVFSLRGNSSVKDPQGRDLFFVKGKLISFTKKKKICDTEGNVLYTVKNKLFKLFLLSRSAFIYDADKHKIAKIKKPLFSANKFSVSGYGHELSVSGDLFSTRMDIIQDGLPIGSIQRIFTAIGNSFCLDADPNNLPFLTALVIAIDNICDQLTK